MEEQVGAWWHGFVTRAADPRHPQAAVTLETVHREVGVLFRALGGDGGLDIVNAHSSAHGARRGWLARLAGSRETVELAWRDTETLRLPAVIDAFPGASLNRELYLWLAAMAALDGALPVLTGAAALPLPDGQVPARHAPAAPIVWFARQQALAAALLAGLPGLAPRYRRLCAAHLAQRPDPARLPRADAAAERAIRTALEAPGSVDALPAAARAPWPVPLWLHPAPPLRDPAATPPEAPDGAGGGEPAAADTGRRRQAKRVADHDGRRGLLAFRLESLFSWADHVAVDRSADDAPEADAARRADDLDSLSIARGEAGASRVKFDLDLPAAAYDDLPLGEGIALPEWHWKRGVLEADRCRVQVYVARDAVDPTLPPALAATARRVRRQFEALRPERAWVRGLADGTELDLDACVRSRAEGLPPARVFRDVRPANRDLACLLLADLSLSTDAHIDNERRVIDVIRDALHLFAEALDASGDRCALYGFSSKKRSHVRLNLLKRFDERHGAAVRTRINAVKPGYYTRMGAAVRYATRELGRVPAARRLLLIVTDGKPNDLDHYEGRFGLEDTRAAVREARAAGLLPFCVTIDTEAADYLPHVFGRQGYGLVRTPSRLPAALTRLYAQLTRTTATTS